MINIIKNTETPSNFFHVGKKYFISLDKLFSAEILEKVNQFRQGSIDHLVIRGLPTSDKMPDTPQKIRSVDRPPLETAILTAVASKVGKISEKGIENTIRFNLEGEKTNKETWHSHFQYASSIFYCLRSDPEAKVYFLSADEVMCDAKEVAPLLTTTFKYVKDLPEFALIQEVSGKYIFSKYIFERSELEKYIEDLDLPDAVKMLKNIIASTPDVKAKGAASYLLSQLEGAKDFISYLPGDLIMVHEPRVIRYSPGFASKIPVREARWLLAVSVR